MVLVVFCSPLVKPPVKVEAAVIPVVAGAAIVAAAMSALGIGVAVGFDTAALADGAQKVWDDLSDSVRNTIVLTQIAGHTVAHFTEQALRDIFSGLVNTFPQVASGAVYTHEGAFSTVSEMTGFLTQLGIDNASFLFSDVGNFYIDDSNRFNYRSLKNFRVIGYYNLPVSSASYVDGFYYHLLLPDNTSFNFYQKSKDSFAYINSTNSTRSISGYSAGTHLLTSNGVFRQYMDMNLSLNLPFVSMLFDVGEQTYTFLVSCVEGQTRVHTVWTSTAFFTGAIPAPGQDVFNPSDEKFYADGASVMNKSVDDVIGRLKDGVGETGQISDQPDVITVPGQIVGDKVTDQTKGADQAGTIGKDISTEADKAANDATNADRDTTKPSTPGEDTDIPDLSIPQIITTKFPFSIPWDLYRSVNILVAPAQAPKWELPLHFDMLNVNTTLTIDLSQFDGIAALLRWGLSLLFLISLIILSSTIIRR